MINPEIKIIITKTHLYLLGLALFNFFLKNTIEISLNYRLAYIITLSVYMSGLILFIWNFRPFKRIAIYFSLYLITPILALLFWLFGGIFLALLTSLVLYPIYPIEIEAEYKKNVVYSKYQGFMGPCCPYEINEKQFLLLEKKIAVINLGKIDFRNVSIDSKKGTTEVTIQYNEYDYENDKIIASDTLISIKKD